MSEWIKCSEKLPMSGEDVIHGYWATRVLPGGNRREFQMFLGDLEDFTDLDTHWMPLPSPPKGDAE